MGKSNLLGGCVSYGSFAHSDLSNGFYVGVVVNSCECKGIQFRMEFSSVTAWSICNVHSQREASKSSRHPW